MTFILGFSGGFDPVHPMADSADTRFVDSPFVFHDSAAVLLRDGEVIAAVEEERLNRIKHTNRFPARAIEYCLADAGVELGQLDALAYYSREPAISGLVGVHTLRRPWTEPQWSARQLMRGLFRRHFGHALDPGKLRFIDHHTTHAMSASALAPFDESLVITLDGQGNGLSGTVFTGRRRRLELKAELPESLSLGALYTRAIAFLGYRQFDEYKVMGLAPYGDPERFRPLFRKLYDLASNGRYTLHLGRLPELLSVGPPRRAGEPFTQTHKDLAAALQATLEAIATHHILHYQQQTGERNLCLVGGLAHNCTLNGKLLRSGTFDRIFVQPAAHDAGCALGAALVADQSLNPDGTTSPLEHLYWGPDVGSSRTISRYLAPWRSLVTFRRLRNPARDAAELLAAGEAIGWVQGRSEFGPRALGNRSILADARPAANKDVINQMVKKREGYRPFAPAVLEEEVHRYFEVPEGKALPYMVFVVGVREEARELLGATTHIDGTARIQTVSRQTNPTFWELIDAFRQRTGVPVLLNTSFNNHREPIVDSVDDAVVCLLTTGLKYLVVGEFLVEEKPFDEEAWLALHPALCPHVQLAATRQLVPGEGFTDLHTVINTSYDRPGQRISPALHALLARADGQSSLAGLVRALEPSLGNAARQAAGDELRRLWEERLVVMSPTPRPAGGG
ncbi:MAG: carbamoyltransferase C-terminal domain-containing protein [Acidobacteriota bacterium]